MPGLPEDSIAREFVFGCPFIEGRRADYPGIIGTLIMNCGSVNCGIDVITERQDDGDEFAVTDQTGACIMHNSERHPVWLRTTKSIGKPL